MTRNTVMFWIVAIFAGPGVLSAQTTPGVPVILFDGQTMTGWARADGQPNDGWVVEDGSLHRESRGGDLYHKETWRDFVLYFQWKISKGGNSGLKYRVKKYGNQRLGCEYQILDDQNANEKNKTACLYDVYPASGDKPVIQPDVWNFSKIVVCGNRIEHWLNGALVVNAHVGGNEWDERVANSKFRDREKFGENREGRIYLQDHGNAVWFRQIVLVPLDCGVEGFPSMGKNDGRHPATVTHCDCTMTNRPFGNIFFRPNPGRPGCGRLPVFRHSFRRTLFPRNH